MKKLLLLYRVKSIVLAILMLAVFSKPSLAQTTISPCDATPFCSDSSYVFENESGTDIEVGDGDGVNIGCLGIAPDPIWYYMEIGVAGTIRLFLEQFDLGGFPIDVDFAMYGPYPSLEEGCAEIEGGDPPIQCSYDPDETETLGLGVLGGSRDGPAFGASTPPSAAVGEVYFVLITNWDGSPGTIGFSQTGGTGSASCSIICGLRASNTGDVCEGQPVTLLAESVDTSLSFEYTWTGPDGGIVGTGSSVTLIPPLGTTEYTVTGVEDEEGSCTGTTTVTVHALPDVTLTNPEDQLLCNIDAYTLELETPSAGATYQWYKDGEPIEGETGTTLTVTEAGAYRVEGSVEFGCTLTSSQVNLVFSETHVDFSFEIDKGCMADTVTFTNLSEAGSYYWHYDDGTTPPDDTATNPLHIYNEQGEYIVRLTVRDEEGCVDSLRKVVDTRHPLDAAFTQSTDSVCQQGENFITFTDASIGNIRSWNWDFGDGSTATENSPTHSFTLAGTHTVRLVVTDDVPCSDTAYSTVYIDSIPNLELLADKDSICNGDRVNFNIEYLYTTTGITWNFGDGTGLDRLGTETYHSFEEPGNYTVTVNTHQPVCDGLSAQANVLVKPYPYVNLGPDTSICLNGAPVGIASKNYMTDPTGMTWLWNTGSTNPILRVTAPGIYTLTADLNGCKTSDEIKVTKDCYTDIPNSFTPNGDGNNDYFYPRQLLASGVTSFSMTIFDRWGQKIFESTTPDGRGWDGKFNGADQPVGVYIYQIAVVFKDNHSENYTGNVTLLR